MVTFTPTELRTNSSKVFNEVQASGRVTIKSKSRPDMVLMTVSKLEEMLRESMLAMGNLDA
jgi:prevent-host-death family protein